MKKNSIFALVAFLFVANFGLEAQNLIPNPGFEFGTGDDFANWSKFNGSANLLETTSVSEVRSGSRALKANVDGNQANAGQPWSVQLVSDLIPTTIGAPYTFTVYVKSLNGGTDIRLSTQPSALYSADYDVTTGWTQLSWTFTANVSMTRIVLDLGENVNEYYLDDMELTTPAAPPGFLNGGFELGVGDEFDNWTKTNGATFLVPTTTAGEYRSDARALKAIVDGAQANAGNPWSIQIANDPAATMVGADYTFRIYARSDNGGTDIRFSTAGSMPQYSPDFVVGTDWALLSWTFTASELSTSIVLDLGENINVYYLDDAELTGIPSDCGALLNNGFEDGDMTNEFLNWGEWNGADYISATTTAGEYRSGNRALKATVDGTQPNAGNPWSVQVGSNPVSTVVGAGYIFSIYAKADTAGTDIRFSTNPNSLYSANYTMTDDWVEYTWNFVANEAETRIVLDLGEFGNTYFLDDACLIPECGVGGYAPPPSQTPIAMGKNKFLGCIYSDAQVPYLANYFNQITPENSSKWGSVETSDGVFDWTALEEARAYAANNNFQFRFHVLLWGSQQPTWLKPLSDSAKIQNIKDWMAAVHSHFDGSSPGRAELEYIEVLNEVLNDPPNNIDNASANNPFANDNTNDPGSGDYVDALKSLNSELETTPGTYDWVINAFKLAREEFGCDAKLMLNDFQIESNSFLMNEYITMVNLLKADNLIDVVGMQGHSFSTQKYDDSQSFEEHTAFLKIQVDALAGTGIPIVITELDIDGDVSLDINGSRVTTGTHQEKDAFQKSEYERIFGLYWNHPAVVGITLWGYRPGHWRDAQAAYIVDPCTNGERPALAMYLNDSIRNSADPILSSAFIPTLCESLEDLTIECPDDIPDADINLINYCTTNCDQTPTVTYADVYDPVGPPSDAPYTLTRTYTVNDGCGNSNSASQVFTIVYEYSAANSNILSGVQNATVKYEVDGVIESEQVIEGDSIAVDYDSGNSILLQSNFEIKSGNLFQAYIDGCGN